ncbi:hypothetical protein ASC97_15475 [Rhizobium sp. Root1203]|uniref:hypothetical protein n=1 Tax=Rhizobium sp. Root1203 TaxID=1736427 RepID=UPI00070AA366|nr:hypothetical protein [Rhizobium sp. Root1203]KQV11321.1 hypothetical protein ASC97_15475 [Rhizobium sp. Root1203]
MTDETKTYEGKPATFKFEVLNMVNGDRECSPACLAVMLVYVNRMIGQHSAVSLTYLEIETGLSRNTIIPARRRLIELAYLKPAGINEKGTQMFEIILDRARQLAIKAVRSAAWKAAKTEKPRIRRKAVINQTIKPTYGGTDSAPHKSAADVQGGCRICTATGGTDSAPNTFIESVDAISSLHSDMGGNCCAKPAAALLKERAPEIPNPAEPIYIHGFIGHHIGFVSPKRCRTFHDTYPHTNIAAFLSQIDAMAGNGTFPTQSEPAEFGRLLSLELREAEMTAAGKKYGRRFPCYTSMQRYLKQRDEYGGF